MAQYQITYFTHHQTLPGHNPWWGPYCDYIDASSIGEAKAIADERFAECHIECIRECDNNGVPLVAPTVELF